MIIPLCVHSVPVLSALWQFSQFLCFLIGSCLSVSTSTQFVCRPSGTHLVHQSSFCCSCMKSLLLYLSATLRLKMKNLLSVEGLSFYTNPHRYQENMQTERDPLAELGSHPRPGLDTEPLFEDKHVWNTWNFNQKSCFTGSLPFKYTVLNLFSSSWWNRGGGVVECN